jgi:hypothetical protein
MGMPLAFRVTRGRLSGTVSADMTRIDGVRAGVLCGAIPTQDLARLPNYFAFIGGGMGDRGSFLEALVAGYTIQNPLFGSSAVGPQQPDIDLDGDGLERFEATAGTRTTPPQITACIDGNGTRVAGRSCPMDPRFADGFTTAFQYNGVWVRLVGVGM